MRHVVTPPNGESDHSSEINGYPYGCRLSCIMRYAWMFVLVASAGWAQGIQNMEIIWIAGGVSSTSSSIVGTPDVLSGSAGFAYQLNFGYQLTSTKAGNLWLETPYTYVFQGVATFTGTTMGSIYRTGIYMTPGLRLKTPTYGRVSFYGALGGGTGPACAGLKML